MFTWSPTTSDVKYVAVLVVIHARIACCAPAASDAYVKSCWTMTSQATPAVHAPSEMAVTYTELIHTWVAMLGLAVQISGIVIAATPDGCDMQLGQSNPGASVGG